MSGGHDTWGVLYCVKRYGEPRTPSFKKMESWSKQVRKIMDRQLVLGNIEMRDGKYKLTCPGHKLLRELI